MFLWVPVAFGLGAALYLGLGAEPPSWAAWAAGAAAAGLAAAAARRGASRWLRAGLILAAALAAGFAVAKLRSDHVAAPVVPAGLGVTEVEGYVVDVDSPSPRGPRLLIAPTRIGGLSGAELPLRVRIVMPPGQILPPGAALQVQTLLDPPPGPAAPGAYDFARDAWFVGDGGVGLARQAPIAVDLPAPPLRLRLEMAVNALRWTVAERLAADVDAAMGGRAGDAAGLAVAVTTSL